MNNRSIDIQRIKQAFRGRILLDEPLSQHTSYRIGGPADYYIFPRDLEDLNSLLDFCQRENASRFVIGSGTNILASDSGYRGIVIDLSETFPKIQNKGKTVTVGAGVQLKNLIKFCTERGLAGLESLVGIPGRLGGCISMNAGAWGSEISDCLFSIRLLDRFGTLERRLKEEIHFGYRYTDLPSDGVIVEAEFKLSEGNPKEMASVQGNHLRERKNRQPLSLSSAGSVFKRPEGDYAGRLIEEAGCKGMRIGDAMVSRKHANFIVNCHLASAQDVIHLMDEVKKRVFDRFEIELVREIHLLGFE